MTVITFTAKDGTQITGNLVHQYPAFEGGMRYIIENHGKQYRCIKTLEGKFVELVV